MLDLRRIRALREVAVHGSFSEAAAALNYTQSAISQQVAQLERQVGVLLVERRGRRIELTPAGRTLVAHTEVILRHLRQAETELEVAAGVRRDAVRIAASASSVATWLPTAMRRFKRHLPQAIVTMTVLERRAAVASVERGQADLAVFARPQHPDPPVATEESQVVVVDLAEDALCLALPVGHRLGRRDTLGLADLADEDWVVARSGDGEWQQIVSACRGVGFDPRAAFVTDDYLAMQGLVAAGLGVAGVPVTVAAASQRGDVALRRLGEGGLVQVTSAAVRPGHEPCVATLLEFFRWSALGASVEAQSAAPPGGPSNCPQGVGDGVQKATVA